MSTHYHSITDACSHSQALAEATTLKEQNLISAAIAFRWHADRNRREHAKFSRAWMAWFGLPTAVLLAAFQLASAPEKPQQASMGVTHQPVGKIPTVNANP